MLCCRAEGRPPAGAQGIPRVGVPPRRAPITLSSCREEKVGRVVYGGWWAAGGAWRAWWMVGGDWLVVSLAEYLGQLGRLGGGLCAWSSASVAHVHEDLTRKRRVLEAQGNYPPKGYRLGATCRWPGFSELQSYPWCSSHKRTGVRLTQEQPNDSNKRGGS